jgi:hypothetical protein
MSRATLPESHLYSASVTRPLCQSRTGRWQGRRVAGSVTVTGRSFGRRGRTAAARAAFDRHRAARAGIAVHHATSRCYPRTARDFGRGTLIVNSAVLVEHGVTTSTHAYCTRYTEGT